VTVLRRQAKRELEGKRHAMVLAWPSEGRLAGPARGTQKAHRRRISYLPVLLRSTLNLGKEVQVSIFRLSLVSWCSLDEAPDFPGVFLPI
jgi:hypothetical protein